MSTKFITIDLKKPDDEFWELLESFKRKSSDLLEYFNSVKWGRLSVQIYSNLEKPRIQGDLPDQIELEAFYRRFRFFILNNEKSNYKRFLNKLSKVTQNDLATLFVRYSKKEFSKCLAVDLAFQKASKKYTSEQIIDLLFNARYFHDDGPKAAKLSELESILSREGAEVSLFWAIWDSCKEIRSTSYLVSETTQINPKVKIPVSYEWPPRVIQNQGK